MCRCRALVAPFAWAALRLGVVAAVALVASRSASRPKDAEHEAVLDGLPEGVGGHSHRAEDERAVHGHGRLRRVFRLRAGGPALEVDAAGARAGAAAAGVSRMRLYHSPTSPFVRKVRVQLHETGLLGRVELVAVSGTPLDSGTIPVAQNPLGKLPVLERADGRRSTTAG